jgi:hypothetical protein
VDPNTELTITRCCEIVFESIPGGVVQVIAGLRAMRDSGGRFSDTALMSILVSACATGFTVAVISFDFDVKPEHRRDDPGFYGYIPDSAGGRTIIFGCMILQAALLFLVRSVSTAFLAVVDGRYV